jgi:arginyl-tRNA synthetase
MKEKVVDILTSLTSLSRDEVSKLIESPPDPKLGDFAFPCFVLSKKFGKNPVDIAKEIVSKIKNNQDFEQIDASGPYINFFVNRISLANEVIKEVLQKKDSYGAAKEKKKVILEFPSPNTNKPLHIGHARNMVLGQAIANILKFSGNKIKIVNLNNDRGIHICKSMLAFSKFGKGDSPEKSNLKTDHFVGKYYVTFAKEAEKDKSLEEQAQAMLLKWENGDKSVRSLWKKMNGWASKGFNETYDKFGLNFDKEYFESEIYKKGKQIIQKGMDKELFKTKPDGTVYVDFTAEGLGEKVLLRADGTSIYITQDIALAAEKKKDFHPDISIILTASEQNYHFKVLFKLLESLGIAKTGESFHLNYGMVNLTSGRMKSREGTVVDSDDLISELENMAEEELKKRYSDLSKKELNIRKKAICMAALRYFYLKVDRIKDITFLPEESISFDGDTGPYLLYSYARAKSILAKLGKKVIYKSPSKLVEQEKQLIIALADFPNVVSNAEKTFSPHIIANYVYKLAQQFNDFYQNCPVVGSDNEMFRASLVQATSIVLKNSLSLLSIPVIEKM